MTRLPLNLLLADDDADDCNFFKDALEELPVSANLTTVNDGIELMQLLDSDEKKIPDALFLDLNMPRKNGYECLSEIMRNEKLKNFPIIIYSTSLDLKIVDLLYEKGAYHYIRKPGDFIKLKKAIHKALTIITHPQPLKPGKEEFIIQV